VKRSGREEPMWFVIHMCMEAMLRIFLYSYLFLKLIKILSFLLFIMFSLQQNSPEQVLHGSKRMRGRERGMEA
jgi:hypothetical protein